MDATAKPERTSLWREIRYILPYMKPYKWAVAAGMITLVVTDLGNLLVPWMVKIGIDSIQNRSADGWFLFQMALLILAIAFFRGAVRFGWRYYLHGAAIGLERDMRLKFFGHTIRLPMRFFGANRIGELLALSSNDLAAIRQAAGIGVLTFADFFISFAGVVYFMTAISPELTMYALIPTPIITLLFVWFGPKIHARFHAVQESFGNLTTETEESIAGLRVVRSYNQEAGENERFASANDDYLTKNVKLIRIDAVFHSLMFLIPSMLFPIVLVVGGIRMIDQQISVGDFIAFTMYIGQLVWPMMAIGWTFNIFQRAGASITRIRDIFDKKEETDTGAVDPALLADNPITIRNLSFTYPGTATPVINHLNLTIPADRTTAIMGRTGSGKTTLLNLLLRLQDPPRGTIFVGDTDILDIPKHQLRALFAVAPQDPFLFTDTIENNIRFGDPELGVEKISHAASHLTLNQEFPPIDSETLEVTKGANLHEEIMVMPEQFETVVGERGTTLSGGQRQRTAIARAFRAKRPILVLDDPLSAVDAVTESKILRFIENSRQRHTLLMVTNRVHAAEMADQIVVLEHGAVTGNGSVRELRENNAFFKEIYHCQVEHEADKG